MRAKKREMPRASHQLPASRYRVGHTERKVKRPRQNIDEEKQIKIRAKLRPSIEN